MLDRRLSEIDLRRMLMSATGYRADVILDRFVVETRHDGVPWEVIVEPDGEVSLLVVVTAYSVG